MLSETEKAVRKTLIKVCRGVEKTFHRRKVTYKVLSWGRPLVLQF